MPGITLIAEKRNEQPRRYTRVGQKKFAPSRPAVSGCRDNHSPASLLAAFKESLHWMGGIFLDPPAAGDPLETV
jgi:hypothetical protein